MHKINILTAVTLLIAGTLTANSALAVDWQTVAESSTTLIEMDLHSVRQKNGLVTAWTRNTVSEPRPLESGSYLSVMLNVLIDCTKHEIHPISTEYFSNQKGTGRSISANRLMIEEATQKLYEPAPGSFGDSTIKKACAINEAQVSLAYSHHLAHETAQWCVFCEPIHIASRQRCDGICVELG